VSTLHLACAADARYLAHSATTIHSVLANRGGLDVHVHYLHGESFPAPGRDALAGMVAALGARIDFHAFPASRVARLPESEHVSVPMWYRIFLPELLGDVDRILYLDCDAVAVDSLEELWHTPLDGSHVAAVTNVFMRHESGRTEALGLERPYFNSGVLLLNLAQMRRDGCTEALRERATALSDPHGYPDQDALNLVLGARRVALHPRWNCMNSVMLFPWSEDVFGAEAVAEARGRPGIRHFEGPGDNKPWHLLCERPLRDAYFEHRRATPWPRTRPAGVTPGNLLRLARRKVAQAARRRGSEGARR
jgi:lipopolysaccharide biosynthesis glycosyltransferase